MVTRAKDGATWRIGTDAEVAWIVSGTSVSRTITSAIPPVFEAYATVVLPYGDEQGDYDRAVLSLLTGQSASQPWLVSRLWDDTWICIGGAAGRYQLCAESIR